MCTGDIHLGRQPGRVEADAEGFSPAAVWKRIVDEAIHRDVDLLALTGDVVDRDNRYFEARGPLERGLRRLGEADIPTVAVAGNHDFDVLPELIADIDFDSVRLLGEGGRWEKQTVDRDGEPLVRLVGWSYPDRHVPHSPLSSLEIVDDELPTVGLLHTEIDRPESPYAPVESVALADSEVDLWLLGHIHRPHRPEVPSSPVLYPGSPQPLDPGEQGLHGPWLVELGAEGEPSYRQLPLATLHYCILPVDLEDVETEREFRRRVTDRLRQKLRETAEGPGEIRRQIVRLRYTGRTGLHRRLDRLSRQLVTDLQLSFNGIEADIDEVRRETRPPLDLQRLADGQDPPAVLAELLLELRDGDDSNLSGPCAELFETIRRRIDDVHRSNAYAALTTDPATADEPDDDWIRKRIVSEGMALLDTMLQQH